MNLFDALALIVCLRSFKFLRDLGLSRNHDGKLSAAELRSWRGFKGSEILRKPYNDSVLSLLKQVSKKHADETPSCLKRIVFVSQTILILLHICNGLSVFLRISFSLSLSFMHSPA